MSFKSDIAEVLKEEMPSIIANVVNPLKKEIEQLKKLAENPFGDKKRFTVRELSEITGRNRATISKDIKAGKLRAFTEKEDSKIFYIPTSEALQYIQNHTKAHA